MTRRHVAAVVCVLAFAGPALGDVAPPPAPIVVSPARGDTAGEATLGVSQRLLVQFSGNAGTGYSWSFSGDAGPQLQFVGSGAVSAAKPRVLGGPRAQTFEFEAMEAGSKELVFTNTGPAGADGGSYTLTVTVTE